MTANGKQNQGFREKWKDEEVQEESDSRPTGEAQHQVVSPKVSFSHLKITERHSARIQRVISSI